MKLFKLIIIGLAMFSANIAQGQNKENENKHSPPLWGPVGYDEVRYYYLPDIETYYDVHLSLFIYYEDGTWLYRSHLPLRYYNYDLYSGYKVVMTDYHGYKPFVNFNKQRLKYPKGYHGKLQKTIGENPGKQVTDNDSLTKDYSIIKIIKVKNDIDENDSLIKQNNDNGSNEGKINK